MANIFQAKIKDQNLEEAIAGTNPWAVDKLVNCFDESLLYRHERIEQLMNLALAEIKQRCERNTQEKAADLRKLISSGKLSKEQLLAMLDEEPVEDNQVAVEEVSGNNESQPTQESSKQSKGKSTKSKAAEKVAA